MSDQSELRTEALRIAHEGHTGDLKSRVVMPGQAPAYDQSQVLADALAFVVFVDPQNRVEHYKAFSAALDYHDIEVRPPRATASHTGLVMAAAIKSREKTTKELDNLWSAGYTRSRGSVIHLAIANLLDALVEGGLLGNQVLGLYTNTVADTDGQTPRKYWTKELSEKQLREAHKLVQTAFINERSIHKREPVDATDRASSFASYVIDNLVAGGYIQKGT